MFNLQTTSTRGRHPNNTQNKLICKLNQITLTLIVVQSLGAGHKHIPLLNENQREAVMNNIAGTLNPVEFTIKDGVE